MRGSSRTRRRRCRLCGLQPEEGSSRHPPKTVALWPCDLGASSASQVASMLLARGRPKGILAPLLAPVGPVARLLEASAVRSSWSRQGHRVSDFEKRRGSRRRRAETGVHARPPWRVGVRGCKIRRRNETNRPRCKAPDAGNGRRIWAQDLLPIDHTCCQVTAMRIRKPPSKTPLTVKVGVCHTGSFRILEGVSHGVSESWRVCHTGFPSPGGCVTRGFRILLCL